MRLTAYVETDDQWYPNFIINHGTPSEKQLVRVSFLKLHDGSHRCCVWGNDDCGMEYDGSHDDAYYRYLYIVTLGKPINKNALKQRGFVNA